MTEVYCPDLGTPAVRDFQYIVSDGHTFADKGGAASADQKTELVDPRALVYRQTETAKSGKWRLTKTYVTDPDRSSVVTGVHLESLTAAPLQLYALYNPRLGNSGGNGSDDTGCSSEGPCSPRTAERDPPSSPPRCSPRPPADTSAAATAGRISRATTPWTGPTTRPTPATSPTPAG